jgi:outer membrane protein assembly factor BamD
MNKKSYFCPMFQKNYRLFISILVLSSFFACSRYQKLLKSTDYEKKYEEAVKYYEKGEVQRALPLFEELIGVYRGTAKAEKIGYYHSYCNYYLGDYIMASYYFKNFSQTFPSSIHAEECAFMNAYCYYLNSPNFSLDQSSTFDAIKELQLFINKYPQSTRVEEANQIIDKLRLKLETKSYETAKLYFRVMDYKAAIIAFNNTIKDFPDTKYKEEVLYLIVKSNYLLAENSVESKKLERYSAAAEAYLKLIDSYPSSRYLNEAESIYETSLKQKSKIQNL